YVARRDRRRSGSNCSPSSVDPVTSANRTVTSLRSSAVRSAGLSDNPQEGQNSKPSGFSAPQFAQVTTSEVYGYGFLPVVRTAPFEHAISAGVSPDRYREELPLAGHAAKAHRACDRRTPRPSERSARTPRRSHRSPAPRGSRPPGRARRP